MLLDIPNQDKLRLGYYIDEKRRELYKKQGDAYTVEALIEQCCAKETYNRMRKGRIIKESEHYDQLLKKLGSAYLYDEQIVRGLLQKETALLQALEKQEFSMAESLRKELLLQLAPYRSYALEEVLYQCLDALPRLEAQQAFYLLGMLKVLDDVAKEIIRYFLLLYIYENGDDAWYARLSQHVESQPQSAVSGGCQWLALLIRQERYYEAAIYCEKLLEQCQQKQAEAWSVNVQICRLLLVDAIQPNYFDTCAQQLKDHPILQQEVGKRYSYLHICGLHAYRQKEYEKAWTCFLQVVAQPGYFFPESIFLYHIATLKGYALPAYLQQVHDTSNALEVWQRFYYYYCRKLQHATYAELEDILWQQLRPLIPSLYPAQLAKDIICTELAWISEHTKDKRHLYQLRRS